jgi:hypothetical protein
MENVMSKIHIWIGESGKSKAEFSEYYIDINLGIKESQFCKDLNINWYDDDLIGVYKSDSNNDLQITIKELPISPEKIQEVYELCIRKEIQQANALFYYADSNLLVNDKNKKYNDLTYIGCFDWD